MDPSLVMQAYSSYGSNAFGADECCSECNEKWSAHSGVRCMSGSTTFNPVVSNVVASVANNVVMRNPASCSDAEVVELYRTYGDSAFDPDRLCKTCGLTWADHYGPSCTRWDTLTFNPFPTSTITSAVVKKLSVYETLAAEFGTPLDPNECPCKIHRSRCDYHKDM